MVTDRPLGNKKAKEHDKIEKRATKNRFTLKDSTALIAAALNPKVSTMGNVAEIQLFQVDLTNLDAQAKQFLLQKRQVAGRALLDQIKGFFPRWQDGLPSTTIAKDDDIILDSQEINVDKQSGEHSPCVGVVRPQARALAHARGLSAFNPQHPSFNVNNPPTTLENPEMPCCMVTIKIWGAPNSATYVSPDDYLRHLLKALIFPHELGKV